MADIFILYMRHTIRLYIALMFLGLPILAAAQETLKVLSDSLNATLEQKQYFVSLKKEQIKKIKQALNDPHLSIRQEYETNAALYEKYQKFNTDSASRYISRNIEIAVALGLDYEEYDSSLKHFIYKVWECYQQSQPKRQGHVDKKLRSQLNVDYIHPERLSHKVGHKRQRLTCLCNPTVKEKVPSRRCHHHVIEQIRDKHEAEQHKYPQRDEYPYQHPSQCLQMVPKRHFRLCRHIPSRILTSSLFRQTWFPAFQRNLYLY